jgi:hypothetical protein
MAISVRVALAGSIAVLGVAGATTPALAGAGGPPGRLVFVQAVPHDSITVARTGGICGLSAVTRS